jgi:hypothetical protein
MTRPEAKWLRFEDNEAEQVIVLPGVPVILGFIDSDREQTIRDLSRSRLISFVQTLEATPHAAPFFVPR